jgi:predicted 3-demethylubiquinone-9 3-methyltransferase (glyoxalase superfamily)
MQKITPNLWFKGNAEEAVNFYLSVFLDAWEKLLQMKKIGIQALQNN